MLDLPRPILSYIFYTHPIAFNRELVEPNDWTNKRTHDAYMNKRVVGKPFQPGNPGGPGKEPMSPQAREAKRLTQEKFLDAIGLNLFKTLAELEEMTKDKSLTMLEHCIIAVLIEAKRKGDHQRLEWVIARTIGKMRDVIDVQHEGVSQEYNVIMVNLLQKIANGKKDPTLIE